MGKYPISGYGESQESTNKYEKYISIFFSNAISYPWTMMIKCGDTMLADITMFRSQWLKNITIMTIVKIRRMIISFFNFINIIE